MPNKVEHRIAAAIRNERAVISWTECYGVARLIIEGKVPGVVVVEVEDDGPRGDNGVVLHQKSETLRAALKELRARAEETNR